MFKDKEEALRRLEAELLREEEEEIQEELETLEAEETEDWEEPFYPDVRAYNSDRLDEDLEEFSEQVYAPGGSTRGRWVAAGVLIALAAVLLVLAFLAARFGR